MPSEREDQLQMKIFKILFAYVLIQMLVLILDINVNKIEETHLNAKTRNFPVTTKVLRNSTVLELRSLSGPKRIVRNASHVYCIGQYKVYSNLFVVLSNVILDPMKCSRIRKGGENISDVLNQNETDEYCYPYSGFFQLTCHRKPFHSYPNKRHFRQWDSSIDVNKDTQKNYTERGVTFAIVRQDYANLYWVIVDIYDIYHVAQLLNLDMKNIEVLIIDTHPSTPLDKLWLKLFPKVSRIGHLSTKVLYRDLVWGMRFTDSPLLTRRQSKELFIQEFRNFILSKINHFSKDSDLNCKNITITIVFRRDYVAHARNPSGKINRKMSNDLELLKNISSMFQGHNVRGVQLDLLPIEEQIQLTSKTDILVGMHGAGLSHVIFLPSHAALVELFPLNFPTVSHFEFLANWRNLTYAIWKNNVSRREKYPGTTTVDISNIGSIINTVYKKICKIME